MRKLHQNKIPDPLVSEGEYIEYTTNNGRVFNLLAIEANKSVSCHGCAFFEYKKDSSDVGNDYYICDCGPNGENSLCYKGSNNGYSEAYCRFIDVDSVMENL